MYICGLLMKKKILLKLLLATLPLLAIAGLYVYADPFLILRNYPDLYATEKPHLELNEDYVTTETFLRLYPKEHFDSYIFGNSRSRYFTPDQLQKRIEPDIKPYYFGVAAETLFGVVGKLKLIDKSGGQIKHILIIADADLLSKASNSSGHLFRKHPLVSGESNADFQFTSFMDFFSFEAISSYLKLPSTMPKGKNDPQLEAEKKILANRDSYYGPKMSIFFKREAVQRYSEPVIQKEQKDLLVAMRAIFDKHRTDYRIVLSPMYDQKKLNPRDMKMLFSILGPEHIYDFSGINDITADLYNYYEPEHYRPAIAYRIMDSVYAR